MKIVINRSHGGFGLSDEARLRLFVRKTEYITFISKDHSRPKKEMDLRGQVATFTETLEGYLSDDFRITWGVDQGRRRTDPDLVAVVEELGDRASGFGAKLRVFEVPDGVDWIIHECDGMEKICSREERSDSQLEKIAQAGAEQEKISAKPISTGSFSGHEMEYFL